MRALAVTAIALAATFLLSPAGATPPAGERYELQPAEGGFVRLDRETGLTSFCAPVAEGYACKPAAEGKSAEAAVIAQLEKRVAELERKVKALSPEATRDSTLDLPSDDQVDRVAGFLERTLRRFKRLAEDLQKEIGEENRL
jgi:hypothetical protein